MLQITQGFAAETVFDAKVLIVGSMPGQKSLHQQHYYAHPRNQFWPIMSELFGIELQSFEQGYRALNDQKIALWDVLARCVRPGSLDGNIQKEGLEINDFSSYFNAHRNLRAVACNGGKATQLMHRHCHDLLLHHGLDLVSLPSTSPANAAMNFQQKVGRWQKITAYLEG